MSISLTVTSQAYLYRSIRVLDEPPSNETYSTLDVAIHCVRLQLDDEKGKPLPEVKVNRLAPELWEITHTQPDNRCFVIGYVTRRLELIAQE